MKNVVLPAWELIFQPELGSHAKLLFSILKNNVFSCLSPSAAAKTKNQTKVSPSILLRQPHLPGWVTIYRPEHTTF